MFSWRKFQILNYLRLLELAIKVNNTWPTNIQVFNRTSHPEKSCWNWWRCKSRLQVAVHDETTLPSISGSLFLSDGLEERPQEPGWDGWADGRSQRGRRPDRHLKIDWIWWRSVNSHLFTVPVTYHQWRRWDLVHKMRSHHKYIQIPDNILFILNSF